MLLKACMGSRPELNTWNQNLRPFFIHFCCHTEFSTVSVGPRSGTTRSLSNPISSSSILRKYQPGPWNLKPASCSSASFAVQQLDQSGKNDKSPARTGTVFTSPLSGIVVFLLLPFLNLQH